MVTTQFRLLPMPGVVLHLIKSWFNTAQLEPEYLQYLQHSTSTVTQCQVGIGNTMQRVRGYFDPPFPTR